MGTSFKGLVFKLWPHEYRSCAARTQQLTMQPLWSEASSHRVSIHCFEFIHSPERCRKSLLNNPEEVKPESRFDLQMKSSSDENQHPVVCNFLIYIKTCRADSGMTVTLMQTLKQCRVMKCQEGFVPPCEKTQLKFLKCLLLLYSCIAA